MEEPDLDWDQDRQAALSVEAAQLQTPAQKQPKQ